MLSNDETLKFRRQIDLKEFGLKSQEKLKNSKVLLVGLGGLGSPAAIYLACAGVGNLGLVEFDTIDASNLSRQILFYESEIGSKKIETAKEKLLLFNSNIKIEIFDKKLSKENIDSIFKNFDLIVDGSDNFETRYLINDTCVQRNIPFIHGSISGLEGMVSLFNANKDSPCYRCLHPQVSIDGKNCSQEGVLATSAGIIGVLMAHESIKYITGNGTTLDKRVLLLKKNGMETFNLTKDPDCPSCGIGKIFSEKNDYELSSKEFFEKKDQLIIVDIRESFEYESKNIGGINLPYSSFDPDRIKYLKNREIVILCYSGEKSKNAQKILQKNNFEKTYNLKGGIREILLDFPADFLEATL